MEEFNDSDDFSSGLKVLKEGLLQLKNQVLLGLILLMIYRLIK